MSRPQSVISLHGGRAPDEAGAYASNCMLWLVYRVNRKNVFLRVTSAYADEAQRPLERYRVVGSVLA